MRSYYGCGGGGCVVRGGWWAVAGGGGGVVGCSHAAAEHARTLARKINRINHKSSRINHKKPKKDDDFYCVAAVLSIPRRSQHNILCRSLDYPDIGSQTLYA